MATYLRANCWVVGKIKEKKRLSSSSSCMKRVLKAATSGGGPVPMSARAACTREQSRGGGAESRLRQRVSQHSERACFCDVPAAKSPRFWSFLFSTFSMCFHEGLRSPGEDSFTVVYDVTALLRRGFGWRGRAPRSGTRWGKMM